MSMVLSLLVDILSARLSMRSSACRRTLTLPPDVRAVHPSPSSASGRGHITRKLDASRILKQTICGQEPASTGNHPPVNVFLGGPAGVLVGHDLNLMLTGPTVVLEVVPVVKLSRPPLILAPSRRAKESIQVHWIQRDGLLTGNLTYMKSTMGTAARHVLILPSSLTHPGSISRHVGDMYGVHMN
ncbi:hypothetical protein PIB30_052527 [Stylosanthes scabra]|uniref:Uncharacterized protein n=1 Tax=Stylosanthes scabra TaxID=79078 RepID=A0ABU6ZH07_9FABA|nr:hypothetical protein [Stylosanthes scabra]